MRQTEAFLLPSQYSVKAQAVYSWWSQRCVFFFSPLSAASFVPKLGVNRGAAGSETPCLPPCLLGWLPLPEPQYFTAFVSAIDSAVNPTPHPWKRFRILIPLPSRVHLNLNAFCKQDFMHDLLSPPPLPTPHFSISPTCSLSHFLAYYPSKESVWRWLQLLWAQRMCSAQ